MTKLLSVTLLSTLLLLAAACKQDPASSGSQSLMLHSSTSSTPANPAITYVSSVSTGSGRNKTNYPTIGVMDSDGTHQTNIYQGSAAAGFAEPTWSPDGGSISWLSTALVAEDVSVNSNGVPTGTNFRTITSAPTGWSIFAQAWCSVSSTGKIAFLTGPGTSWNYLCTVSATGGGWDTLAKLPVGSGTGYFWLDVSWSPDDSKIAIAQDSFHYPTHSDKILIFDMTTRAFTDSVLVPSGYAFLGDGGWKFIEWSRTGLNKIAFNAGTSLLSQSLYYVTPTTGSTATTNGVTAAGFSWSPNNSSLAFGPLPGSGLSFLKKVTALSSTVTTVASSFTGSQSNWKR